MISDDSPCLTSDLPAIPFTIRTFPEDFRVEEVPAYEPSGEGDHVYITIEKRELSTLEAVRRIARVTGAHPSGFGYAGLKDARSVSVQTLSVEHIDPARLQAMDDSKIRILAVSRHRNKIKTGHLKGNRFILKLRDFDFARLHDLEHVLKILETRGVPNYFGAQRFGMRGDNALIGQALLKEDYQKAAYLIAGNPGAQDSGRILQARELFMEGKFGEAARYWPSSMFYCSVLCRLLESSKENFRRAVRSLDKKILKFYVSAFQSKLFNEMLARRIQNLDRVMKGDWAVKLATGGVFKVEDEAVENERAKGFEISALGPLFGKKARLSEDEPFRLEEEILARHQTSRKDFEQEGILGCEGDRRAFRFKPEELSLKSGSDAAGQYVELRMTLPSGCYATALLKEVAKGKMKEVVSSSEVLTNLSSAE